jgi:hypothetical protein
MVVQSDLVNPHSHPQLIKHHPHTPHTPKTNRKFSEIDRMEESIATLIQESRGFFETDAELEERAKVNWRVLGDLRAWGVVDIEKCVLW